MLRKEDGQKDFFDSYVYERLLPEKHILLDIKRIIDFSFIDEEVKPFYSEDMRGRPPFPAQVMFRILFLEFFYSLSDYDVVEQVRTNVLFRYFAGLGISQDTPDDTTIVKFRQRLGEEGFKKLFNRIVTQAQTKGLICGKLKILDATHIQADIALSGVVNFLRHGRKIVVKKISKTNPKGAHNLKEKFVNEERLFGQPTNEQIQQELKTTKEFITEAKDKASQDAEEIIELLETAVSQQQRKLNNPNNKEPDEVISFTDKDARFGHKSLKKRFVGYKAHASLDDGSGIVTSVRTIKGNCNEGTHQEVKDILQEDRGKGIKHKAVCTDSLYDSYKNRKHIHKQKMTPYIPSRTKAGNVRINLERFRYDSKNDLLICPESHYAASSTPQEQGSLYIFSNKHCSLCHNLYNCSKRPSQDRTRIFISDDYKLQLMSNPELKKQALIKRKGIERKFGEVKKWHRLHRARYRQKWRVAIQTFMTFSVVNIKRMTTLLLLRPEYAFSKAGFT